MHTIKNVVLMFGLTIGNEDIFNYKINVQHI